MNTKKIAIPLAAGAAAVLLYRACKPSIPEGAEAVQDFNAEKYLGKWFEIARLDFRHEKNLNNVTADYSLKPDGSVKVVNRGYNYKKNEWEEAIGEARFVNEKTEGRLKVTFFKPFWSGYNVIDLVDYQYALIAGDSLKYMWILSRSTHLPEDVKQRFLQKAKDLGYQTEDLVWVEHQLV